MRKEEKVKIRIRHSKIGKKGRGGRYIKEKVDTIVKNTGENTTKRQMRKRITRWEMVNSTTNEGRSGEVQLKR